MQTFRSGSDHRDSHMRKNKQKQKTSKKVQIYDCILNI